MEASLASLEYAAPQARESPAAFLVGLGQAFAQALVLASASVVDTEPAVEKDTVAAEDTASDVAETFAEAVDLELVVVAIDLVVLVAEALAVVAASSPSMEVYLLDSYFHLIVIAPKDLENSLAALAAELSPDEVFPHMVVVSQQIPLLSAP